MYGWSRFWNDCAERSSRAVVVIFDDGINLRATGGPLGASASHTSAKPPRPRTHRSRYPGDGSAPTAKWKAPGVVERILGWTVNTAPLRDEHGGARFGAD